MTEDKLDHIDFERYHIVHDSRGIIWISTYGNGLFAYDPIEDKLEHFAAGRRRIYHSKRKRRDGKASGSV